DRDGEADLGAHGWDGVADGLGDGNVRGRPGIERHARLVVGRVRIGVGLRGRPRGVHQGSRRLHRRHERQRGRGVEREVADRPRPLCGSYVPREGVAETSPSPAGSRSSTTTPVASFGPRSVAVTVNVTVSPTDGVVRSTVFWSATSAAAAALIVTAAVSLLVFGSGSLAPVLAAVLVTVPACVTRAASVSSAKSPAFRLPT